MRTEAEVWLYYYGMFVRKTDTVFATVASGETFFDQVYFFGHADAHVRTMLKMLELQSEEQKWVLQLSAAHLVQACPTHSQRCSSPGLRQYGPPPKCFPADAKVLTPEGHKAMKNLQVCDTVLATDVSGETFSTRSTLRPCRCTCETMLKSLSCI